MLFARRRPVAPGDGRRRERDRESWGTDPSTEELEDGARSGATGRVLRVLALVAATPPPPVSTQRWLQRPPDNSGDSALLSMAAAALLPTMRDMRCDPHQRACGNNDSRGRSRRGRHWQAPDRRGARRNRPQAARRPGHHAPTPGGRTVSTHLFSRDHGDLAIVAVGLTETYPAGKHKTFTTIASALAAERRCRTGWNGSGRPLVARPRPALRGCWCGGSRETPCLRP
jgi:hypothetical protein